MNAKEVKLLQLLHDSAQVLKTSDPELSDVLADAYQKIENGENYKIVCVRIRGKCNHYVLNHISYVPKPVGELNNLVQEISKQYILIGGSVFNSALYNLFNPK